MLDEDVIRPLIVINLIFFALEFIIGNSFTNSLMLSSQHFLTEPWRLLTHMFLHSQNSLSHLFFNMYALFIFGPLVQQVVGPKKFLQIYLGTGLIAAIVANSYHLLLGQTFTGLGASGAIMGILGVMIILIPRMKLLLFFFIPMPLWIAGILWFILDTLGLFGYGMGGVANIAHLGGMISGLLIGLYLKKVKKVSVVMRY